MSKKDKKAQATQAEIEARIAELTEAKDKANAKGDLKAARKARREIRALREALGNLATAEDHDRDTVDLAEFLFAGAMLRSTALHGLDETIQDRLIKSMQDCVGDAPAESALVAEYRYHGKIRRAFLRKDWRDVLIGEPTAIDIDRSRTPQRYTLRGRGIDLLAFFWPRDNDELDPAFVETSSKLSEQLIEWAEYDLLMPAKIDIEPQGDDTVSAILSRRKHIGED